MLDADGKIAHALAGRVEDGVGDRRCDADERDFAEALDAKRIDVRVLLLDEMRLELRRCRDLQARDNRPVGIDRAAVTRVEDGPLHQRHADAADHAAGALAGRQARIDDAAGTISAECAPDPDQCPTSGSTATSTKTAPKACIE